MHCHDICNGRCELDAARAYNQAARSLHGSAAKLNLLPDEAQQSTIAPSAPSATPGLQDEGGVDTLQDGTPRVENSGGTDGIAEQHVAKDENISARAAASTTTEAGAEAKIEIGTEVGDDTTTAVETPPVEESRLPGVDRNASSVAAATQSSAEVSFAPEPLPPSFQVAEHEAPATEIEGMGQGAGIEDIGSRAVSSAVDAAALTGTGGKAIDTQPAFPEELDFRDLEEIPISTGPSLWDTKLDSAWVIASADGGCTAGGDSSVDAPVHDGMVGGRGSGLFMEDAAARREEARGLVPGEPGGPDGNGDLHGAAVGGPEAAVIPLVMRSDEPLVFRPPSTTATTPHAAAAAMASVPGQSEAGPARSGVQPGSNPPAAAEAQDLGSSSSWHPAERPAATAGDQRLESGPPGAVVSMPITAPGGGTAADAVISESEATAGVDGHLLLPAGKIAVAGWEEARQGDMESVEGAGEEGGQAWLRAAAPGGGGWERDETGDEFYEEKLKGVVDVRCVFGIEILVPAMLRLRLHLLQIFDYRLCRACLAAGAAAGPRCMPLALSTKNLGIVLLLRLELGCGYSGRFVRC